MEFNSEAFFTNYTLYSEESSIQHFNFLPIQVEILFLLLFNGHGMHGTKNISGWSVGIVVFPLQHILFFFKFLLCVCFTSIFLDCITVLLLCVCAFVCLSVPSILHWQRLGFGPVRLGALVVGGLLLWAGFFETRTDTASSSFL